MAHAYTPGLKVSKGMTIRKERRLPLKGTVLVDVGNYVHANDVVAKADLPGNVQLVNIANKLSVPANDVVEYTIKNVGEPVEKDEVLAETQGIFGLFKSQVRSPITGEVENISNVTGQVILREAPIPVEVIAYVDGSVAEVAGDEGITVETYGTYIQGIFGIGGETLGVLEVVVDSPDAPLTPDLIQPEHRGKILVGGSIVSHDAIREAIRGGVRGLIAGGIDDQDLRELLGYELGVAITGSEDIGITLVVTEGFGKIRMADRTFNLLRERQGLKTSINGTTQIRAGVVRPEIIVPTESSEDLIEDAVVAGRLEVGTPIR
ncbi:MAG: hypothetical protein OXI86_03515, partial [Candidatus Poribacteria bacterium]|nr:hypothetical protein [Candidatus Poribacteria bacterium]